MSLNIHFGQTTYSDQQLASSLNAILEANIILSMATVQDDGSSYINMAHFAYDEHMRLYIFTSPQSQHSLNLELNPSVAVSVWNRPEAWGTNLQGMQLFGTCELVPEADLEEAIAVYTGRFPTFANVVKVPSDFAPLPMRLYRIAINRVKLIDEPQFGYRNFITAQVA